jgi:hypothetical protein
LFKYLKQRYSTSRSGAQSLGTAQSSRLSISCDVLPPARAVDASGRCSFPWNQAPVLRQFMFMKCQTVYDVSDFSRYLRGNLRLRRLADQVRPCGRQMISNVWQAVTVLACKSALGRICLSVWSSRGRWACGSTRPPRADGCACCAGGPPRPRPGSCANYAAEAT